MSEKRKLRTGKENLKGKEKKGKEKRRKSTRKGQKRGN